MDRKRRAFLLGLGLNSIPLAVLLSVAVLARLFARSPGDALPGAFVWAFLSATFVAIADAALIFAAVVGWRGFEGRRALGEGIAGGLCAWLATFVVVWLISTSGGRQPFLPPRP